MRRFVSLIILSAFLLLPSIALAQQTVPTQPRLELPIPNISFADAANRQGFLTTEYIALYVAGAYQFLISIVGVIAALMIIYGGYLYITAGGDATRAGKGKERILNALLGLTLAFGSYLILFVINPNLVNFTALELSAVRTDYLDFALQNSTADTGEGVPPGSYTKTTEACPWPELAGKADNASRKSFYENVQSHSRVTGAPTIEKKVLAVAEITDACDMNLGSCGATSGAIYRLAGIVGRGKQNCLDRHKCGDNYASLKHYVPQEVKTSIWGIACYRQGGPNSTAKGYGEAFEKKWGKPEGVCTKTWTATMLKAQKTFKDFKAGKYKERMAGWPDQWLDNVEVGDYLVLFNANNDPTGGHAAIFVGWWEKDKRYAQVIEGGGGPYPKHPEYKKTRVGRICLRSACKNHQRLIIQIRSPHPKQSKTAAGLTCSPSV